MILYTQRLKLRPFSVVDANDVYLCAKDSEVGLNCGWSPHKDVNDSKDAIRLQLSFENSFAICMLDSETVIGAISILRGDRSNLQLGYNEIEIGGWIGRDYWNNGYMTEALLKVLDYAFNDLKVTKVWAVHFEENIRSKSVLEKVGFKQELIWNDMYIKAISRRKNEYIMGFSIEDYIVKYSI